MTWSPVFDLDTVPVGGAKVHKKGRDQIAVFRLGEDELYAIDNRCPHEGYPLCQGALAGKTITCCWHNFKFDLASGACIMGEEDVQTFPVRIRDGVVELSISPPDPAIAIPRTWASFEEGLAKHSMGRVARDVVRLIELGVGPVEIACRGATHDANHGEWGPSHGVPICVDILRWSHRFPGPQVAIPLVQALDMVGHSQVRRPPRPRVPPADGPVAFDEIREQVEAEEAPEAEAAFRGFMQQEGTGAAIQALLRLCSDHFLDFGHALIYVTKAAELHDQAPEVDLEDLLAGLCFGIVNGTREDVLPPWHSFMAKLDGLAPRAAGLWQAARENGDRGADLEPMVAALLDGKTHEAFAAVLGALEGGTGLMRIVDGLSLAAARRMLRFDTAIDPSHAEQDNWLWLTHAQTFAAAVRASIRRADHPDLLRLLFFGARFVNHTRPLDLPPSDQHRPVAKAGSVADLVAAIQAHDGHLAVDLALGLAGSAPDELREILMEVAMSEPAVRPIVVTHVIKNTVAALDEWGELADPTPVLAVVRLLAHPPTERRVRQRTEEAIEFVTTGKIPRTRST